MSRPRGGTGAGARQHRSDIQPDEGLGQGTKATSGARYRTSLKTGRAPPHREGLPYPLTPLDILLEAR
jgi:hypothetical protein